MRPRRSLRPLLIAMAMGCLLVLPTSAGAAGSAYLPPAGKVWHGVASGDSTGDFEARTGRAPAVWQQWLVWNGSFEYTFDRAEQAGTRLMLHLSTARGQNMAGKLSPGDLAKGDGDGFILKLSRRIAEHGHPVYIRLMAEMNNCDLAYSSHNCNGTRRNAEHSPGRFKQAWRRVVVLMRGGETPAVNDRLRRLGLPPVSVRAERLPEPQVAFLWSPMTGGSPMISALRPAVFWPGTQYVDWVSTSFYSRFPNFRFLEPYYRAFAQRYDKPFAFGEWAMWGSDDPGFAAQLFAWVRSHNRVRMMLYNQGEATPGLFRLRRYPRAARVIRAGVRSSRFAALPPEARR